MNLRLRLALTTLAVALPVLVCLLSLQRYAHQHAFEDSIIQTVLLHMENGGRARCEADPQSWSEGLHGPPPGFPHGPRYSDAPPPEGARPPEPSAEHEHGGFNPEGGPPAFGMLTHGFKLHAYDATFTSRNAAAPALPAGLQKSLSDSKHSAFLNENRTYQAVVRMPWSTGPCAFVGITGSLPPMRNGGLPPIELWLPPLIIALGSIYFALGPVLRRLRRLTQEVSRAPLQLYATPIEVTGSDEISALSRAFATAGQEIRTHLEAQQARERTLRNFLENTTHDVSIPLTVLQGFITQIQSQARKEALVAPELADAAMNEAHYIASLLHNLNVAAKLEAGEPHIQRVRVDLNAVVMRAVGRHAPVARKGDIALVHGIPEEKLWVLADVTLIEQAISNVIYNAIRYNKAGGHVAVTLDVLDAGRFVLDVTDDGPGIPAELRQSITERYARGNDARTRHPQGTGLGLNIAKRVCALHTWDLALDASSFGGLQVRFCGSLVE